MKLDCNGKTLDLSTPCVMGILNVTPDSFSDGGKFMPVDAALQQGLKMQEQGAAVIDVGGESTRPGAKSVSLQQELDRVIPVIEALSTSLHVPISIDTSKPEVMDAAVHAGAGMINDVYALRQDGAVKQAARLGVPVCLMHMQGKPRTMQKAPHYENLLDEIKDFLAHRIQVCVEGGIPQHRILIDPGFGFGKTQVHNLQLLRRLSELSQLECAVLVGISRKSMLGALTGREPEQRMAASIAAAVLAAERGAQILRVHDVEETVDALKIVQAISNKVENL